MTLLKTLEDRLTSAKEMGVVNPEAHVLRFLLVKEAEEIFAALRADLISGQRKILSVSDASGVPHDIMGDDFAAACLNDVFAKLNRFESAAMKGKGH